MKHVGHLFVATVFFIFGILQWNDPDPYLWIAMYIYVGICILLYVFSNKAKFPILIGIVLFSIVLIRYVPDVNQWFKDGTPSIVGSMKAESEYIELIREFFGLLISLIVLVYYFVNQKKRS